MAGNLSLYKENLVLEELVGKVPSVTRYIGLFTVIPDEDGVGGTEASAGNYIRKSCAAADWGNAANGAIANAAAITFIEAAVGNWGTIVGAGIFEDESGGNMLSWFDLDDNKVIDIGDTMNFAIGSIDITCT